ncbi:MAG: hypothetical protein JWQ76_3627 [Ramlibacter sp.]|nr:hypothetical protein [Ramlibacter sp.]
MTTPADEVDQLVRESVKWRETDDPDFPYEMNRDQVLWKIRINDFPDEPLYSLMRNGVQMADFDDWPPHWER